MKKLIVALCFTCALMVAAQAADKKGGGKKPALTEEQKAARKELMEKYDANKDGKLDEGERAKIPADELQKAGMAKGHAKKKA